MVAEVPVGRRDETRSGQSHVLDDEVLRAANVEEKFQVPNVMVILHLHSMGKSYKLSKWVHHTL